MEKLQEHREDVTARLKKGWMGKRKIIKIDGRFKFVSEKGKR
jgi:hypothetical protein